MIQRFFYKWIPTAFDLFGTDNSSSADWAYVWGLKGRYHEREDPTEADRAHLNESSRELYRREIVGLVDRLNRLIPDRDRWLKVPSTKFNRKIGQWAHQMFTVTGEPMTDRTRYEAYLETVLPQPEHHALVRAVQKEPGWIDGWNVDHQSTGRDEAS